MNGLDLFSGIGGITQALAPWVTPVAYCEVDAHAQRVLLRRMASGELPGAPIWDDVRSLTRGCLPDDFEIDIIYGGFPCQDISTAGLGAGLAGKRSGLFHEICRLAREFSPSFIFLENVAAIRTRGLDVVLQELAAMGFDARWTSVSADYVDAPHRRERWFLLASHPDRLRVWDRGERLQAREAEAGSESGNHGSSSVVANTHTRNGTDRTVGEVPNANVHGQLKHTKTTKKKNPTRYGEDYWRSEAGPFGDAWFCPQPEMGGGTDGLPDGVDASGTVGASYSWEEGIERTCEPYPGRVEEVKQLGNAVVPIQVRTAFQYLAGF